MTNGEVVEAYFRAYERGGFDGIRNDSDVMSRIHPEVEFRDDGTLIDGRQVRGIDEIEQHFREVLSWLGDPQFILEDLTEGPDSVVSEVRIVGAGPSSGAPVEGRMFFAWWFRDGQIVAGQSFAERDQALAAAGI